VWALLAQKCLPKWHASTTSMLINSLYIYNYYSGWL